MLLSVGPNDPSCLIVQDLSVDSSVHNVGKLRLSELESFTEESMILSSRPLSAPRAPAEPPRASKLSSFHPSSAKKAFVKSSSEEVPEKSSSAIKEGPAKLARKRHCENMRRRREQQKTQESQMSNSAFDTTPDVPNERSNSAPRGEGNNLRRN